MKKALLCIIFLIISTQQVKSTPMWNISNDWICNPKLHTKIDINGNIIGINELAITTTIDFNNSKIVSSTGSVGIIIDKIEVKNPNRYIENILVIDWKGWGKYSTVITHNLETNQFWNWKSSGMSRGTIYSAYSKCKPI